MSKDKTPEATEVKEQPPQMAKFLVIPVEHAEVIRNAIAKLDTDTGYWPMSYLLNAQKTELPVTKKPV